MGRNARKEVDMAGLLDGKSALITGGGGGIGRATSLAFAREGARVAVADAAEAAAQETVALINKAGGQAMTLTGDVTDAGAVEAMVKSVVAAYGRLDCAFNNAGIAGFQVDAGGKVGSVVRPHDRGEPEGRLAVHEARAAADGGAGRWRHRQHRVHCRADRVADVIGLRRREAWRGRADQDRG